jgi:tyrosyl-tRNA synthetase
VRSPEEQLEIIKRGTVEIIPEEDLLAKLREGRPLRCKYGVDASGPDITLGHAVPIRKLREMQDLGHQAVLIVGDFTGMIGDPAGRSETRRQLTREDVERNMTTYREQIFKILDPDRTEFRYNSEWLASLTCEQIIRLAASHTLAQMLQREDFANRFQSNESLAIHELLYPLLQGYDSVMVNADIELGGTEQKFSFLVARELQRHNPLGDSQPPQVILTVPILVGTDGVQRMGKSLHNYIGISEPPDQQFGKIMSIPDNCLAQYYELCTSAPMDEIATMARGMESGELNPRDAKMRLAEDIVRQYHGEEAARTAVRHWEQMFVGGGGPVSDEIADQAVIRLPADRRGAAVWAVTALVEAGLAPSKSEARRLIEAGGAYCRPPGADGERQITDPQAELVLEEGLFLRVGKRRMAKIAFEGS